MQTSTRAAVDPFIVMDVVQAAAALEAKGRHICHLEVGQPSSGAPVAAQAALTQAMGKGPLGYTVALGLPQLRARIARLYLEWYGVDLDPNRVVVTSGSSAGFVLAFTALFDAGARVGAGAPGYPSYRQIMRALSLRAIDIETTPETRYQLTPEQIRNAALDGVMVASPANPTGTMLDEADLRALIDAARDSGTAFLSDEIYHGIDYGKSPVTALQITDDVYVLNSFSKYFAMTGWRIGWMIVPPDHVRQVEALAQNMFICAPHASQLAALAAMEATPELEANLDVYRRNRSMLLEALPQMGFGKIAPPEGGFYIYADISDITTNSRAFCDDLLLKAGVAVTPGLDFDPARGHGTVRFSYARSTDEISEAIHRLRAHMADL